MEAESVSVRYHIRYADYVEGEDGLARHLGFEPSTREGVGFLLWRLAIDFVGRIMTNEATITNAGIKIKGGPLRPWSDIGDAFETDRLIVFVLMGTTGPITLPKAALTRGDIEVLRAFVAASRIATTRSLPGE